MSALESLVGQKLQSANSENGELGLAFPEAKLAIYNPLKGSPIENSIGADIQSVEYIEKQKFVIKFNNQTELVVSLKDSDYSGPEAFCVTFSNGVIVVE